MILKSYPGHDDISIRMTQTCDWMLLKSLFMLFQISIKYSYYPDIWKRFISIHFSSTNFGKCFEKIISNKIYNFLLEEKILNPNQSGFLPFDSCVNKLLATTHF